ncbi:MAG TPA: AmmeMemoRadiSam system protein A [Thermotogaceae bacterium]|nr:AmmeMemoRadiSam system protein A [Thermotogaceae bacterium]
MKGFHPFVRWAIEVIENYIRRGVVIEPTPDLPEELLNRKAGAFVSLHRSDGSLRGCIGTFLPTRENLALEIRDNAIAAATRDPRFPPLTVDELDDTEVSVDILSKPEPVEDLSELDPKRYGVIVESGWKRGLLLPDLEGVNTIETQLEIAKRKAGIYNFEKFKVYRFTVERYH